LKVQEELEELLAAESVAERTEEIGDLLWMLANLATRDGIDPELALRNASRKFEARFQHVERIARERGWGGLTGRPTAELLDAWETAKRRVSAVDELSLEPKRDDG
jgi:ATP diphosphatase